MKAKLQKIPELILTRPILSIFLGLFLSFAFIPGLVMMKADFSHKGYYRANHPLILAFNEFEKTFGGDDRIAIVMHSEKGIFTPEVASVLSEMTEKMWLVTDMIRVDSLSNYDYTRAEGDQVNISPFLEKEEFSDSYLTERKQIALQDEVLPNYLISKDAKTTMIIGRFRPLFEGEIQYKKGIEDLRQLVASYEGKGDIQFYLAGNAMVNESFREVSQHDLKLIIPILLLVIIFLLFYTFRNVYGLIFPFVVIGLSILVAYGSAGYLGVNYNNIISAIPIILIAVSIADTIHLLLTFYQFKSEGQNTKSAILAAANKNLLPTFLTSLSTAIGFFSLVTSQLLPIAGLGLLGGIGAMAAWAQTYLIIVPLCRYIPDSSLVKTKSVGLNAVMVERYTQWLKNNCHKILIVALLLSVGAAYVGTRNEINSDPLIYLSKDVPFRQATEFLDHNLGGASGVEVVINSGVEDGIKEPTFIKKVEDLQNWMESRKVYTRIISYVDIVKGLNRALEGGKQEEYRLPDSKDKIAQELFLYGMSVPQGKDINDQITVDNSTVRLSGLWTLHSSKIILQEINLINQKIKEMGLDGKVTGKMPVYHNMNGFVVQTFFYSILSAIALIGLMMIILFRSIRVGLMSMIPNIIPLFFGAAVMAILQKPLDIGTVIIGAICLGIAIDDTIHFLVSYTYHMKHGMQKYEAIKQTLLRTGVALVETTVILIFGFSSFLLADFVPNLNLGIGTIVILFVALIMDLVLLPAILFASKRF